MVTRGVARYTNVMTRRLLALALLFGGFALAQNRVYELRTYTCYEGKLPDLLKRFREHTITIFNRHGMESIGYWVPQDAERSKTTLIYILAHPSREAATKNWTEFRNDPEWKKVSADSEANGKIVMKVDSVFMDPTDFSKLK
jgi:NIPSNAP